MRVESPLLKRCCCCLPLRRGLLGWGYFNVVTNSLASIYFIMLLCSPYVNKVPANLVTVAVLLLCFAFETAFNIVLLVACHKKSAKLLRVTYIYCIVFLLLMLATGAFVTYVELRHMYHYWQYYSSVRTGINRMLYTLGPMFFNIFVQVYVTLLIRSEMVKLRNQSLEVQFVNHAADGEARCVRADPETKELAEV